MAESHSQTGDAPVDTDEIWEESCTNLQQHGEQVTCLFDASKLW